MQHKRKRITRRHGSETHGHGSSKKHRGAGNKGGRGKSGSGKRGDFKLMKVTGGDNKYLGRHGFSPKKNLVKAINIKDLESKFNRLLAEKKIDVKDGMYAIDFDNIGYDKLLANGTPSRKYSILCKGASQSSIEKIEKAGGKVEIKNVSS